MHDTITHTRAKGKVPTPYDINRADKGSEQQHWQVIEGESKLRYRDLPCASA